jgi:hypothetical protein
VKSFQRIPRTAPCLLLAAVLASLLAACSGLSVRDDLPPGAEKGWVVFACDDRLLASIARIVDAREGEPFASRTARGTPVATACPPGRNDFVVHDRYGETRVRVPVAEGMVTYVGVALQVASGNSDADGGSTAHHTRISVGTHPLPFEARVDDPAPLVTALVDGDWATRWAAARALARIPPPLEPSAAPLLTAMAREDAYGEVRAAARSTLAAAGRPVPPHPLAFLSFAESADGWPLGEGLASTTSLVAEGYVLEVNDPKGTAWRAIDLRDALAGRGDLDVLLECRWLSGKGTTAYGLTLGSGPGTFHAFCVSREGASSVIRFIGGRQASAPLPGNASAAAAITGTTVTRIEVVKRGARFEVTANGEDAGGFSDTNSLGITHLGVFADGEQAVVFRKIVVTAP